MKALQLTINFNSNTWSPSMDDLAGDNCLEKIKYFPFAPSIKVDKLGSVCDFSYTSYSRGREAKVMQVENHDFHLVDSRPFPKTKIRYIQRRFQKETTQAYQQKQQQQEKAELLGRQGKRGNKLRQGGQNYQYSRSRFVSRMRTLTEWSIEPLSSWTSIAEIPLTSLPKQSLDINRLNVEDIAWYGILRCYNKFIDRISPKLPVPLRDFGGAEFLQPTTSDDDVLREALLIPEKSVDVAITDQILACLVAATQSKYSWHILVTHIDGKLIFDKQDGSIIDLVTVNETSAEPPLPDNINKNNRPHLLGMEALKANQNFTQNILLEGDSGIIQKYDPSPFAESCANSTESKSYRYRIFSLPPRTGAASTEIAQRIVRVAIRTEVDAKLQNTTDENGLIFARALSEYDMKTIKTWNTQLETQKGALLATEIRNNACQLTKWATQALLSSCDTLKLGYIVRRSANDRENHVIMSVQSYKTRELSAQMGLKEENAWGITRALIDLLAEQPEGQYVILRTPVKHVLRVYKLPEEESSEQMGENTYNHKHDNSNAK
ncbi:eukaryotic translation initiation factor 3 subunit 7 family protein [Cryptosporidium serpentis]